MLDRKRPLLAGRWIIAIVICAAIVAFLTQWQTKPSAAATHPLSPVELQLVGTWAYPADQSGAVLTVTFNVDRTYTYEAESSIYPARWRIDGTNLIIEQKVKTIVGGAPFPIPFAVRNFQLPKFMAHTERISQSVSFSPDGHLHLSDVWPAYSLTRSNTKAVSDLGTGHGKSKL